MPHPGRDGQRRCATARTTRRVSCESGHNAGEKLIVSSRSEVSPLPLRHESKIVKWTVRLVLCFLIAWLPLRGFAMPALVCPHDSLTASVPHAPPQHATMQMGKVPVAGLTSAQDHPACHGSTCSPACGSPAIYARTDVPAVAVSSVAHVLRDTRALPQFIPSPPRHPPKSLSIAQTGSASDAVPTV